MERAVAWIFRNYDANLFLFRSFSFKCLSTFFWGSFGWNSEINTSLEKLKNKMKKQVFLKKKTLSSFLKASSTKMEGAKYPGESWVACLIYLIYPLPSICVGLNANLAVVLLQMHCQTKLRRSPCSVFPLFKTWGRNFFLSWNSFFPVGAWI